MFVVDDVVIIVEEVVIEPGVVDIPNAVLLAIVVDIFELLFILLLFDDKYGDIDFGDIFVVEEENVVAIVVLVIFAVVFVVDVRDDVDEEEEDDDDDELLLQLFDPIEVLLLFVEFAARSRPPVFCCCSR